MIRSSQFDVGADALGETVEIKHPRSSKSVMASIRGHGFRPLMRMPRCSQNKTMLRSTSRALTGFLKIRHHKNSSGE